MAKKAVWSPCWGWVEIEVPDEEVVEAPEVVEVEVEEEAETPAKPVEAPIPVEWPVRQPAEVEKGG